MKRFVVFPLIAGAFIFFAGCKPSVPASPPEKTDLSRLQIPTNAQPKLQTLKLYIGAQEMNAELALTEIQEQTGMMFRTNMGPNDGMLFVFAQPLQASFWMMNTILPLSAAYISPNGTVLEIHDLLPHDTNAVLAATDNIQYVLETPKDWFKTNHIEVGTVITSERGTLHKIFFER